MNFGDDYLKWGTLPGLFGAFNDQPNPANSAMPYFNQATGALQSAFNPYIQAGNTALPQLQSQYGQLMNNPGGMVNKFGSSFHQSPGFNFQVNQATGAANRAAAAGGMAGSPMEQQSLASTVNGLANQDYYNYLNHAMSAYGMGLQGEGNLANMGFGASRSLGEDLANAYMNQGNLAYAGQVNQNEAEAGKWPALFGMFSGAAGAAAGGF